MSILTADIAAMAKAVVEILKDSQAMQDIGATVERGEPINEDPSRCPWVGVYLTRTPFPSRALGMGGGYRAQDSEFIVICQATNPSDGAACQDSLGLLVQAVTSALLSDPSLKGTVQMLGEFDAAFDVYQKVDDAIFQSATVRGVGLTTVSGG
jgi:hypothetical protein